MFWLHPAKLETKLVCFSGLAGRGVARDGLPALPLRVLLENAKNGSATMVAHAGCRVCRNRARGWRYGFMCGPDARRAFQWPAGVWRWPWAIIYSRWPPQKMQLRTHGMLMAHVRDLGFSHVCAEITTSTCMDSMLYTYMSSKHAITVHILCVVPWAQPSPSWRAPCSSNQGMCTWVNECYYSVMK